jgi:heterotetrameric sarcosine oxidase gamma subunit
MIRPERAIMIDVGDDRLRVQIKPPATLLALEIWGAQAAVERGLGASLPQSCRSADLNGSRWLWWEPGVWLVRGDAERLRSSLEDAVGDHGAVTNLSGGFVRIGVMGALWRDLLMIGGVFDAESPSFGPGSIAGTVIHHMPVRLDVIGEDAVEAYVPPSYAGDLMHHWTRSAARLLST